MSVKKSESLKGVRVPSFDDLVDEFMEYVPRGYVDLADEARRDQLRSWIRRVMNSAVARIGEAHTDAVKNLMYEMSVLMHSPKFYEEKKRRRKEKLAATAKTRQDQELEAARKLPVF